MASAGAVLLEARPFRPFKSSEEYLYAMKEDLAEWMTVLYPELRINADNFLDRLDTGVVAKKQAPPQSIAERSPGAWAAELARSYACDETASEPTALIDNLTGGTQWHLLGNRQIRRPGI
ncbi:unnamed protein product [Chilo suppressalis]|uniref:Uncharacterized protein n=1 Tax=Chilo suppressalis TaxID=168631 RepID=A0ABN8B9T3_CHISP|nr:unnamed protein product [Chilo suppressalis]